MKTTLLWLLSGLAALLAWSSTFQVGEGDVAIVSRFGDPRRVVPDAGLHLKWPAPVDTVTRIDRRVHVLDPSRREVLTADKKNVLVDAYVAWRVDDPRRFLVSLQDRDGAEARLTDVLHAVVGEVMQNGPFDDLVSVDERERDLEAVSGELTERLRTACDENGFGVEVVQVGIKRLNFPEQNKDSVFRRMRAEREGRASAIRAEGRSRYEEIRAEAELEQARALADADEEALRIRGEARAEATRTWAEALARNPALAERLQKLELLAEVPGEGGVLILPADDPLLEALRPPEGLPEAEGGDE